jgi:isopentenyldiphosphate isomerase
MEETLEIWDPSGIPTGQTALKSEVHRQGWFHPTVHIWFYTPTGKVLLQKRGLEKDTFPGLWDVSVAGHVQAGETPMEAAIREVKEEIGLEITPAALDFLGRFKSEHAHPGGIVDREFQYSYLSQLAVPLATLVPQAGEVEALEEKPLTQFAEEAWGLARPGHYVPHSGAYYGEVVRAIKSRL